MLRHGWPVLVLLLALAVAPPVDARRRHALAPTLPPGPPLALHVADEVRVGWLGDVTHTRTIHTPSLEALDGWLRRDPATLPSREDPQACEQAIIAHLTAPGPRHEPWQRARFPGPRRDKLVLSRSYPPGKAPFASHEPDGMFIAYAFELGRFLQAPLPPMPEEVLTMGPWFAHDAPRVAALHALRQQGFAWTLTVQLPGQVEWLWWQPGHTRRPVTLDLLEPWPTESDRSGASNVSSRAMHPFTPIFLVGSLVGLRWLWRYRRERA